MTREPYGDARFDTSAPTDDPIDVRHHLKVLRRNAKLIVGIVVLVTGVVVALSYVLPKTYDASTKIIVDTSTSSLSGSDATTLQRDLATTEALATTSAMLDEAARAVPGETGDTLSGSVTSSVDANANIIAISVGYKTAEGAAKLANAVAAAFVRQQVATTRNQITSAQSALNDQIVALRAQPDANGDVASQVDALRARSAELSVALAGAGSNLQTIQPADVPSAPASPKPFRNGVIALFASFFLAVLVALGRDQLAPRISGPRELSRLLGLPVLSGIPAITRRTRARDAAAVYETYQNLSAALRLALPPNQTHVVLVSSATHEEGKTTVTGRLGRLLAQAGHPTLLVSGDLRWPRLDSSFEVVDQPGLRDLLTLARESGTLPPDLIAQMITPVLGENSGGRGRLDLLPAGRGGIDASQLLSTASLRTVLDPLRELDYTYVLVDAPPLLGIADAQVLADVCDNLLVVARLDRLTMSTVVDMREMLDRSDIDQVGLVVIGVQAMDSPYYWSGRSATPSLA